MLIPSPGDSLSRDAGLVTHYGVAVGWCQVLDIVRGGPPRIVPLKQFAAGQPVSLRRTHADARPAVIARAWEVAESQNLYNIITFNCEHLKNFVLTGRRYSETVTALGLLLISICVLARGRGHCGH